MLYLISDFAQRTGLTARALRLYDAQGLLPAHRDPTNGHRYYRDDDLLPARRIALLRALGFSLPDIALLLAAVGDPTEREHVRAAFAGELERCRRSREELDQRESSLVATLRVLEASPDGAGDLSQLAALRPATRRELMTHYRNASARYTLQGARDHQEDASLSMPLDGGGIYVVADGCGHDGLGAEASQVAVDTFAETVDTTMLVPASWARHLGDALRAAHEAVRPIHPSALTTLTALVLHDGVAYVAHVGDTRAYRLTADGIVRLTRDHSVVQDLVDAGELDPSEAATHPSARLLSAALGTDRPLDDVFLHREEVTVGTRYLLVSDGVTRSLGDAQLADLVRGAPTAAAARAVVEQAVDDDNTTVVVVDA